MRRGTRSAAVVLSLTVTGAGLAAGASGAGAESAAVVFSCGYAAPGEFDVSVVLDTDAPSRMTVGQVAQVTATGSAVLPSSEARAAYDLGARSFDGVLRTSATFGALPAASVDQTLTRTSLGDQSGSATAVAFSSSSTALAYTAPTTPGPVEVAAVGLSGTWQFYDASGSPSGTKTFACNAPRGRTPVVDTISVVSPSMTTITLDRTTSEYGQDVTVTASVATTAGAPDGVVAFSVDGLATAARVGADGIAVLVLPDAGPGPHAVTATFVPRDATAYDASASAGQSWTVTRARTRIRIPVTGRTTSTGTRVGVRAKGVFDTVPTGKVRFQVTRLKRHGKWVRVRTLDDTGSALAGFGRLPQGRYRAVVTYRGDALHADLKKTKGFRVRRG